MSAHYVITKDSKAHFNNQTCYCVGTGRMGLALQEEYQSQLVFAQNAIRFSHIRGHGLFCDDMAIYDPYTDENGNEVAHYNFTYLDRVFDFYLRTGLKPFLELGFMPQRLASGTQTIFYWKGNTTAPKDHEKWEALIRALLTHLVERYGREEVITWPCEVWNEPNLPGFWEHADLEGYLKLYDHSVKAVKEFLPEMKVGGPAVCGGDKCIPWITAFLEHCRDNDVPVDFVTRHIYMAQTPERKGRYTYHEMCDPAFSVGEARETRKLIDSFSEFKGIPLHITEYNTSYNPRCPTHDTLYNGTLICAMLSELGDWADSYSYWTFGDVFEETGVFDRPFHGGFGLIAEDNIPKPTFHAYRFFSGLHGPCVLHKKNAVFTREGKNQLRGVVWNLCQKKKAKSTVRIEMELDDGEYCALIRTVDHDHGNPLYTWHCMGEPASLQGIQKLIVKESATPGVTALALKAENGRAALNIPLEANAFCSVDIMPAPMQTSPGYVYPEAEN